MKQRKNIQRTTAKNDSAQIRLNHVSKVYSSDGTAAYPVLQDISLEIGRGEFVSIVGTSGCGKSTLMRIMSCQEKPTDGEYLFSGVPLSKCSRREITELRRHKIAVVPQSYCLNINFSVSQNIEYVLEKSRFSHSERHRRTMKALRFVGLAEKADWMPGQLSGGQQQRVAIARAIVQRPDIIFADEPTGALDMETKEYVFRLFQKANEDGTTVILVTHDYSIAARTKRMIRVQDGQIFEDRVLANAV